MATTNKDFKIKNGLIVEGANATVNGNEVLTNAASINALSDVTISSPTSGQVLKWNGSAWVNDTGGVGGGISNVVEDTTPQLGGDLDAQSFNIANVNSFTLDTTPTSVPATVGTFSWDEANETAQLLLNGATLQIGQEHVIRVKNADNANVIPDRTVVMFAGATGDTVIVSPAVSSNVAVYPSDYMVGITTEEIPASTSDTVGFGFVTQFGFINHVNTAAWTVGTLLYVDPETPGGLISSRPSAPAWQTPIAAVTKQNGSAGRILVRAIPGININRVEGVEITAPTTDDVLRINSTGIVVNSNLAAANIANLAATGLQTFSGPITITGNANATTFNGSGEGLTSLNALSISGTVPIANGGTNSTSIPTAGAVAYGTGAEYGFTAAGTSGQILSSTGSGAPEWTTPTLTLQRVILSSTSSVDLTGAPSVIYAVVVGGGGGGGKPPGNYNVGGGGGAGAVVSGWVPASTSAVVGAGGSTAGGNGGASYYSGLFAEGGIGGGNGLAGSASSNGAGAGGAGNSTTAGTITSGSGSTIGYQVGGAGGSSTTATTAVTGSAGSTAISGGGGGGAVTITTATTSATGGAGGSGLVGAGGGGAASNATSTTGQATGGAGGSGLGGSGATGTATTGTATGKCSAGAGGAGYLVPGIYSYGTVTGPATGASGTGSTARAGGRGGDGGGGGGGGVSTSGSGGQGGIGCVLLYW